MTDLEDYFTPEQDNGAGNQKQLEEMQQLDHLERVESINAILNNAILRKLSFEEVKELRDFCGLQ